MKKDEQRIIMRALARRERFLERFKGVPSGRLARVFNRITPGIDWRQCTKGRLADAYAAGESRLACTSLDELAATLEETR